MENKKLLLQDIAGLLAAKENISKKKAEAFCRLIFDVIEEGLAKDKYTKIRGLGTFKLVPVSERESIDVNTGERIQISGYSKVAFTPDNMIKDLVNRPFAHFQTVVVNDEADIDELDYNEPQEEETEDSETEAEAEEVAEETPQPEEPASAEEEPAEEPKPEEQPAAEEQPAEEEPVEEEPKEEEPAEEPAEEESEETEETPQPVNITVPYYAHGPIKYVWKVAKTIHRPNWWKIIALTFFVLLLMALSYVAGYYKILCPPCQEGPQPAARPAAAAAPQPADSVGERNAVQPAEAPKDSLKTAAEPAAEARPKQQEGAKPQPAEEEPVVYYVNKKYSADGVMQTYVVKTGDNLYKIARRVYGHKEFAKYIIEFNHIKNPDNIGLGSKVKLPNLKPAE